MTTKPSTTDTPLNSESSQEPSNESRMAELMAGPDDARCADFLSAFNDHCAVAEVERSIRERQLLAASSHAEITERDRALLELNVERERLLEPYKPPKKEDTSSVVDLEMPTSAHSVTAQTSAVVADSSASDESGWAVKKPERFVGYSVPLYRLLVAANREGKPRPTARDVLEAWRVNPPAEVAKVLTDSFDYYDSNGNIKAADLKALSQAIKRMTSAR